MLHLIQKEILDQLLSLRFLILSGIGALVVWLSLFSGYSYYQNRVRDFRIAQEYAEQQRRHLNQAEQVVNGDPFMVLNTDPSYANKPPTPLSIFVRGLDPGLGRTALLWANRGGSNLRASPMSDAPMTGLFPPLDLGLVVQILFSLFVLLFTYDAICGEKEAGTLRLLGSFSTSRVSILLSKFLGAWVPTMLAFLIPLLLGSAVLAALPDVGLGSAEWSILGLIVVAFCAYLTAYTCAGLFASSLVHRSATAFVILLALWVSTVVVLPRMSLIIAGSIRPAPSVHEYQAELSLIGRERLNKHRELRRVWTSARSEPGKEFWRTPEGREAFELYFAEARYVADAFVESRMKRLDETFQNKYNARLSLAVGLAHLSPAFAVRSATVGLAGTGLQRHERFGKTHQQHLIADRDWYRETKTAFNLQRRNTKKYGEPRWDATKRPRFTFSEKPPKIQPALFDIGLLALWSLLFFAGAYAAFLKYDLR